MLTFSLVTALVVSVIPKVGDVAPAFSTKDVQGKAVVLSELVKEGTVVLAFFPKVFTSGCTRQFKAFAAGTDDFSKRKATVIGVSMDGVADLQRFQKEIAPNARFIADPEGALTNLYDVKMPVLSMASRYTFVIGKDQRILRVDSGDDAIDVKNAANACEAPAN